MEKSEVKKVLMELIYTPDAKPRFVGGDVNEKLKRIDDAVDKLVEMANTKDPYEEATHYLCDDDEGLTIREMVDAIAEAEDNEMIDNIEGVLVWEPLENRFTVSQFLDLIGY